MKDFLSSISIAIGSSLGVLTFLEIYLGEKQKKWIIDKAATIWLWLADQKAGKFIKIVLNRKFQILYTLILFGMLFYYGLSERFSGDPEKYKFERAVSFVINFAITIFISFYVHAKIINKFKITSSLSNYLFKSFLFSIIFFVLYFIQFQYLPTFSGYLKNLIYIPVTVEYFLFLFMFLFAVFWIIIVYIMMVIFSVLKFITLRIADNPKGPVIAISGLLAGLGALVKVFYNK